MEKAINFVFKDDTNESYVIPEYMDLSFMLVDASEEAKSADRGAVSRVRVEKKINNHPEDTMLSDMFENIDVDNIKKIGVKVDGSVINEILSDQMTKEYMITNNISGKSVSDTLFEVIDFVNRI